MFLSAEQRLGVLLHAKEYPAQSKAFPHNLGYCQAGSPLHVSERALDWRNYLWYQDHLVALDLGEASPLLPELVPPELRPLRTTWEGDFGRPVMDVYLFSSRLLGTSDDVVLSFPLASPDGDQTLAAGG